MAKFKTDQWVTLKGADAARFHILEVVEQTCPGGKQVWYTGRVFVMEEMSVWRKKQDPNYKELWLPAKEIQKFNEVELGDLVGT